METKGLLIFSWIIPTLLDWITSGGAWELTNAAHKITKNQNAIMIVALLAWLVKTLQKNNSKTQELWLYHESLDPDFLYNHSTFLIA